MSELYGRRRLYQVCNLLFLAFTVLCGESTCVGMLLAFRVLAGCAGVAPLTIGGGTIGDLMTPDKRAGAMAIFSAGPLLGPVVGRWPLSLTTFADATRPPKSWRERMLTNM